MSEQTTKRDPLVIIPEFLDKLLDAVKKENAKLALFKEDEGKSSDNDKLEGIFRLGQVLAWLDICDALTGVPVVLGKRVEDQVLDFRTRTT